MLYPKKLPNDAVKKKSRLKYLEKKAAQDSRAIHTTSTTRIPNSTYISWHFTDFPCCFQQRKEQKIDGIVSRIGELNTIFQILTSLTSNF